MNKYYGLYFRNARTSLMTVAQYESSFPVNIEYDGERYSHQKTFTVSTPSQKKQFLNWCLAQGYVLNVELNP